MRKITKITAKAHGNGFSSETSPKWGKQDANLRKNGFLHFQIGLIVAMLLVYFGLEFAFSKVEPKVFSQKENDPELMEFQPERFIVEQEKVDNKPIQKLVNPEEFIVKPDDFEVPKALEFKNEPAEFNSPIGVDDVKFIKDIP